ncbi:MAG: EamA family transporter [Anaerolineales bacterium]|nr:MAG: EamA family transporter [Anaerolineales bacterium]
MNLFLLSLLGVIWGTSFLFIKIIVNEVPPLTLVAGRTGFAALILWGIIVLQKIPLPKDRKVWYAFAIVGIFNGALPYTLISWGEQFIPSGWASLLQATTPIFTILAAHFMTLDDRITGKKAFGVILGFTGVGLLMLPEIQVGNLGPAWGMLAIVGSSISYALASIFARKRLQGQPPMLSTAGQLTFGFAYILPLSIIFDRPFLLTPSTNVWLSWAALTLFGTVIAYNIYYTLLERTNATFTVSVTYIVPIFGSILGALILHENLNPIIIVSLLCILIGVLLVKVKDKQRFLKPATKIHSST